MKKAWRSFFSTSTLTVCPRVLVTVLALVWYRRSFAVLVGFASLSLNMDLRCV